jgi:triosephosphate isomerase
MPVLCVGETLDERKGNKTDRVLKKQLEAALLGDRSGGGAADHGRLRAGLGDRDRRGRDPRAGRRTRTHDPQVARPEARSPRPERRSVILYGGSVKPENVAGLLAVEDVDGVLGRRGEPEGRHLPADHRVRLG